MFKCDFCKKELSSQKSLKTHQTTTKRCLEIQKNISGIVPIENIKKCLYCDKEFTQQGSVTLHEKICKAKMYDDKLNNMKLECEDKLNNMKIEYETRIRDIETKLFNTIIEKEKILAQAEKDKFDLINSMLEQRQNFYDSITEKLAEKQTVSTTNTIKGKNIQMNYSYLDLSKERIESAKDKYTLKHYEKGCIGQVDWAMNNILMDANGNKLYTCTDKNRRCFMYKDEFGNLVIDIQAKKLKASIYPVIELKINEYKKIKCRELAEVDDDDNSLLDKYIKLYTENKEMGIEFEKELVSRTYG